MLTQQIRDEVERLRRERDAVILAHYYVPADVQELADHVGDSFALSKLAASIDCSEIVFCGVRFMGESAKLLSPGKRVLMPSPKADCPMAHMLRKETIDEARATHEDLAVVCYVNSTAEAKSWSDVCVTSANAERVVRALPQRDILFVPDYHLGHYLAQRMPEKNFILNDGFCPTHEAIEVAEVLALKDEYPQAEVLAHPECPKWVLAHADYVGSTTGIIKRAAASDASDLIILTACGVRRALELATEGQGKRFHFPATTPTCPNMATVTLERLLACLREGTGEVDVDESIAEAARRPLARMLELAG